MTALSKDQRVIVSLPGGGTARGVILEVYGKSYRIWLDDGLGVSRFSAAKVKPESGRKPTAKLSAQGLGVLEARALLRPLTPINAPTQIMRNQRAIIMPVPKPELPEECPAWLAFVRKQPCCNCGATQNIEAHHEGKKGLSQKVRDTMAVPLCRECHRHYTDTNTLPRPVFGGFSGAYTREESQKFLRVEQDALLQRALSRLDQPTRIELLSKGLAKVRDLAPLLGRIERAA